MVTVKTAKEVRKSFVQWNGWGPPTSEYQIGEYCRAKTFSEEDSDYESSILIEWLNES